MISFTFSNTFDEEQERELEQEVEEERETERPPAHKPHSHKDLITYPLYEAYKNTELYHLVLVSLSILFFPI